MSYKPPIIEIPPGIKRHWEEFGEEVRACWDLAHSEREEKGLTTGQMFEKYWGCMRGESVPPVEVKRCEEAGHPLTAHWMCVGARMQKGASEGEAKSQCVREGKVVATSYYSCKRALGEIE